MSLSKQLLILISALFLMVFSVNFILSVNNIKSYLEGESQVHAQDTATSLGLSLSPHMAEETDPIIESMMNAIFDMGYYQKIELVNIENRPLVSLTNNNSYKDVPEWFVKYLPMKTATAASEISSGWNISGVVYVTVNPGYAYLKLYEQAKNSFYFSLIAFALSIFLLLVILRLLLSSLKKIDHMAVTIAAGKFETIEQLPWTTEVRNVTTSMNMMSRKIEGVIKNFNTKLEAIGKKLHQDDLTGLYKKSSFETDMKNLFAAEFDAFILMIKIDGLTELVKELDNDTVENFLKDLAQVLATLSEQGKPGEITPYRFFGSEFVLLLKNITLQQTEEIAKKLRTSFLNVGEKYQKTDIAHIGVTHFNPVGTTEGILLAAHEAYEQAKLIGANSYYIRTGEDRAKDIAEWKSLVFSVIDNQTYKVSFVDKVESFQSGQVLMEEAFTHVTDKNRDPVSIAVFVSIAEKYEKVIEFDKGVTNKVIDYIKSEKIQNSVAINLSTRTITNNDFREWLFSLLKQNASIAEQLVFSLSAYAVAKDLTAFKGFIEFAHKLNAKVIIKRFETLSMSPETVKDLKPDFIRLARDIGNGISVDEEKKIFVETIQGIGELLDIRILAENIHSDDDFACIKAIGIAGASR